jgi:hypothetical protein
MSNTFVIQIQLAQSGKSFSLAINLLALMLPERME